MMSREPTGLDRARLAWLTGNTEGALWLIRRVLLIDADDGRAWELRGLIHRDRSEPEECVSALEMASLLVPLSPLARFALAESYGKAGRRELSRDLYLELVQNPATTVPLLLQAACGLDSIDRPAAAMWACRSALDRDPGNGQACYDMSYYAARSGCPLRIVESLARKAVSLEPDRLQFRIGLASLLLRHDRAAEAGRVISGVSPDQLHQLDCQCCLERIAELCETVGDWQRVVVCRERLLQLEARSGHNTGDERDDT
ncbi:MAG: hypothetical protein KDA79_17720 [Planctomycetaceae bacterium]|nr:hypothetical protein [Planctomycetaceae bacterium]